MSSSFSFNFWPLNLTLNFGKAHSTLPSIVRYLYLKCLIYNTTQRIPIACHSQGPLFSLPPAPHRGERLTCYITKGPHCLFTHSHMRGRQELNQGLDGPSVHDSTSQLRSTRGNIGQSPGCLELQAGMKGWLQELHQPGNEPCVNNQLQRRVLFPGQHFPSQCKRKDKNMSCEAGKKNLLYGCSWHSQLSNETNHWARAPSYPRVQPVTLCSDEAIFFPLVIIYEPPFLLRPI